MNHITPHGPIDLARQNWGGGLLNPVPITPPEFYELSEIVRRADRSFIGDGYRELCFVKGRRQQPVIRDQKDKDKYDEIVAKFFADNFRTDYDGRLRLTVLRKKVSLEFV